MNIRIQIKSIAKLDEDIAISEVPQPPQPFCWAECLGDCSTETSREHLISSGSIDDEFVSIEGASWCKGETLTIPKKKFKSSILCKAHNNVLTEVDREGISALHVFEEMLDRNAPKKQKFSATCLSGGY